MGRWPPNAYSGQREREDRKTFALLLFLGMGCRSGGVLDKGGMEYY